MHHHQRMPELLCVVVLCAQIHALLRTIEALQFEPLHAASSRGYDAMACNVVARPVTATHTQCWTTLLSQND